MSDAPPASKPGGIQLDPWFTPVRSALIIWGLMSLIAIAAKWRAIGALDLADTDDAMRMAQVRDLLAGQGWWDLAQYRVNPAGGGVLMHRSEEHTSELQSLMRISYAVFCLKKKNTIN